MSESRLWFSSINIRLIYLFFWFYTYYIYIVYTYYYYIMIPLYKVHIHLKDIQRYLCRKNHFYTEKIKRKILVKNPYLIFSSDLFYCFFIIVFIYLVLFHQQKKIIENKKMIDVFIYFSVNWIFSSSFFSTLPR